MNELHDACAEGDLERVETLLDAEPDLIDTLHTEHHMSPVCFALENEHWEVAKYLLLRGAKVIVEDKTSEGLRRLSSCEYDLARIWISLEKYGLAMLNIANAVLAMKLINNPRESDCFDMIVYYKAQSLCLFKVGKITKAIAYSTKALSLCKPIYNFNKASIELALNELLGKCHNKLSMGKVSAGEQAENIEKALQAFMRGTKIFERITIPALQDYKRYFLLHSNLLHPL